MERFAEVGGVERKWRKGNAARPGGTYELSWRRSFTPSSLPLRPHQDRKHPYSADISDDQAAF